MTKKQPNILLVITDQQRTETLGFMGKTPCKTPHVDRLAREGISFDRALCTNPLCLPARASLFTGKYPHQVNMMLNSDTLEHPPVLTDSLKALGYHTAYAGKWHLEPPGQPKAFLNREKELGLDDVHGGEVSAKGERVIDRWFDKAEGQGSYDYSVWCEENGLPDGWGVSDPDVRTHRKPSMTIPKTKRQDLDPNHTYDAWVTDIALRFLDERPGDQPFFLVAGYFGPHPPFLIPEPYYSMYNPADIPEPPNFKPQPNKPQSTLTSYYHQLWLDHGDDWDAWKKSMAVYWGFCTMMDDLLGRLISRLESESILDDTLIIFISDHGEMLGSHGLWHKMMPYEEALRVPMVMRYPSTIDAGIRSQANVSLIDIPSTILSIAGADIPNDMVGIDLTPAFASEEEFQDDAYRFSEYKPLGAWQQVTDWRLVTDNTWKYVWNNNDLDELYHIENDPYELDNLIDNPTYAETYQRLKSRLNQWMQDTSDPLLTQFEAQEK